MLKMLFFGLAKAQHTPAYGRRYLHSSCMAQAKAAESAFLQHGRILA